MGLALAGLAAQSTAFAETRSYVLSWIVPAMYAHDGDCQATEPILEPGRSAIESMYRKILLQMGKTPEEADALLKSSPDLESLSGIYELLVNRGRIDGKPVNVYQNPESIPDPQINTVVGKYGLGFNLDGLGAASPNSFEDPYTHERGINNQYYRATGCIRSSRVVSPEKSSLWEDVWNRNIEKSPAVLITVTGADLRQDGDVTVSFDRTIERTRKNALSLARRDMTFRIDPNPLNHAALSGKIKDGIIILESGHLKIGGPFATTPFDLTNTHLRLRMTDGSLEGMLAGYQPWQAIYHFFYTQDLGVEAAFGINAPGVYYALKKLADADPDPASGQNRRISIAYAVQAVPAFIASDSDGLPEVTTAALRAYDRSIPLATPVGITIQVPAGGGSRYSSAYRERTLDHEYFATGKGMALYTYDHDRSRQASCYGDCAREWPPLIAEKGAKGFGEWSLVVRRDGAKQWAYRGKPLYTFAKDTVIGQPTGVPLPDTTPAPAPKEREQAKSATTAAPPPPWKLASYKLAGTPTPNGITVQEVIDANGEVLVDSGGKTLYTFSGTPGGDNSSCQAARCERPWIPFAAGRLANPVGDFALVRRKDGITQWTYKGKGLYKFRQDLEAGNAKGIGVDPRWQAAVVKQFYLPAQVRIRESFGRGKVLTDEHGMTLYRRSATRSYGLARSVPVMPEEGRVVGTRSCDTQCMHTWIPFAAPADAQPGGFWEVLTRQDGGKQWSYKGYALYRYAGDQRPGDVKGTFIYDLFSNGRLAANLDAAGKVAADIQTDAHVALIWSHMYP